MPITHCLRYTAHNSHRVIFLSIRKLKSTQNLRLRVSSLYHRFSPSRFRKRRQMYAATLVELVMLCCFHKLVLITRVSARAKRIGTSSVLFIVFRVQQVIRLVQITTVGESIVVKHIV